MVSANLAAADRATLDLGLTEKEAGQYSVARAILQASDSTMGGLESDISQTLQSKLGRPPRNGSAIFVPSRLRASGLDTKTNGGGGFLKQTKVMDLIDALRAQMRLTQLGATLLPNLKFSAQFPVEDSTTSAYWVEENPGSDVTAADMSFRAVLAHPHALQCTTSARKQLFQQASTNLDLERRLRLDMTRSTAQAFDLAAINGGGILNQPLGLLKTSGTTVTAIGVNGGVPTYSVICDMEAAVANANAPDGIGWLSTPNIRKLLRKTYVNGTGSSAVWEGNQVLGSPAMVSADVPSALSKGTANATLSAIIAGAWSEMILCEFGVVEYLVDQFAQKKRGILELTSFQMVDVAIPRPSAFNVCLDAALS